MGIIRHLPFFPLLQTPENPERAGLPVEAATAESPTAIPAISVEDSKTIEVLAKRIGCLQKTHQKIWEFSPQAKIGPSSLAGDALAHKIADNFIGWYQKLSLPGVTLHPSQEHQKLIVSLLEVHVFRPNISPTQVVHDMVGTMRSLGLISNNPEVVKFWSDNLSDLSSSLEELLRPYGPSVVNQQAVNDLVDFTRKVPDENTRLELIRHINKTQARLLRMSTKDEWARFNKPGASFERIYNYIGFTSTESEADVRRSLSDLRQLFNEEGTWAAIEEFKREWGIRQANRPLNPQVFEFFVELKRAEQNAAVLSPRGAELFLELEEYYALIIKERHDPFWVRLGDTVEFSSAKVKQAGRRLSQLRELQNRFYPAPVSGRVSLEIFSDTWGIHWEETQDYQGLYRPRAMSTGYVGGIGDPILNGNYQHAAEVLITQLQKSGFHFAPGAEEVQFLAPMMRATYVVGGTLEDALYNALNFLTHSGLISKNKNTLIKTRLNRALEELSLFVEGIHNSGIHSKDSQYLNQQLREFKVPPQFQGAVDDFVKFVSEKRAQMRARMLGSQPLDGIYYLGQGTLEGSPTKSPSSPPLPSATQRVAALNLSTAQEIQLIQEAATLPGETMAPSTGPVSTASEPEVVILPEATQTPKSGTQAILIENLENRSTATSIVLTATSAGIVVDPAISLEMQAGLLSRIWQEPAIQGVMAGESIKAPLPEQAVHSGEINFLEERTGAITPKGRLLATGVNALGGSLAVFIALGETQQAYRDPNFLNLLGAGASTVSAGGFIIEGAGRAVSFIPRIRPGTLIFAERMIQNGSFAGQFAGGAVAAVFGLRYFIQDIRGPHASWFRTATGPLMAAGGAAMSYVSWAAWKTVHTAGAVGETKVIKNPFTLWGLGLMAYSVAVGIGREYALEYDTSKALSQAINSVLPRNGHAPSQAFEMHRFEAQLAPLLREASLDDDVAVELVKVFGGKNSDARNYLTEPIFNRRLFGIGTQVDLHQIPAWAQEKTLLEIFDALVTGEDGSWNLDYEWWDEDRATHEAIQQVKVLLN